MGPRVAGIHREHNKSVAERITRSRLVTTCPALPPLPFSPSDHCATPGRKREREVRSSRFLVVYPFFLARWYSLAGSSVAPQSRAFSPSCFLFPHLERVSQPMHDLSSNRGDLSMVHHDETTNRGLKREQKGGPRTSPLAATRTLRGVMRTGSPQNNQNRDGCKSRTAKTPIM